MNNQPNNSDPDRNNQPPQGPGRRPPAKPPRNIYSLGVLLMIGVLLMMVMHSMSPQGRELTFSEFSRLVQDNQVDSIEVEDATITGKLHPGALTSDDGTEITEFTVVIEQGIGREQWFQQLLSEHDVEVTYRSRSTLVDILIGLVPWILILVVMYFLVFRQFRGAGGAGMLGSFGRSRHRMASKDQAKVTFKQVAGIDEAKDEVQEIIHFLRNPKKFQRLGGRIPRGILLVGDPGCGKTLLAKAIAGEADVPLLSISGSDFVEMFVGVGASRVRDLFRQAKEISPCIIFLDEIDAVGRKRGVGVAGGGHDEREQTLNAILVEMDGFSSNDQVIVIAATNRGDVLDHALTRPGRFDRQIYVPLPDVKGRAEILQVHAAKVKLGPDTDLHRLARGTPMFSGADLEAIINEAALAATMQNKDYVEMCDLEEARDKVRWGRARRSRTIDEKEQNVTAFHEAGHALVQSLTPSADPIHKVSIIPRGRMGGATFSLPEQDRTMYTKSFCLALIRVCFGGRVAEEVACGEITSGAQMDIEQATNIARQMVKVWGMSEKLGFIKYGADEAPAWPTDLGGREYSEHTAEVIDSEIKDIMNAAYNDVKKLILENRDKLDRLKAALLKYETLSDTEVKRIMDGETLDKPTVGDLIKAEQAKTSDNNHAEHQQTPSSKDNNSADNSSDETTENQE
ncbi:MAG: ATP-dependent zinc metalloprotease FtsH [Sedimentisphaerales bacterium]|nr:ATP-dependent zinc metalloprotease FtsH [Sedimentisphaerales bacterium]